MGSVVRTDIVIAIRPQHVANIASGIKDHEYRKYLLPHAVRRFWIYETSPTSAITYVATVSHGKQPGEIANEQGLRNKEFNEGKLTHLAKYAYEILDLKKLDSPLKLQDFVAKGWLGGPPQKYCYIKDAMMRALRNSPTTRIIPASSQVSDRAGDNQQRTVDHQIPIALASTGGTLADVGTPSVASDKEASEC
jgi:predicted transcriptional regulator